MDDAREIGAELRRLADTDPLRPIDAAALLARGRRGRRRRRLLSAGGGIAAVAAVAVAASLLPNLERADPPPGVAETSTPATIKIADFTAVPGVPRGEAGAGLKVSYAEAARLCALRYPQYTRPIMRNSFWRTGYTVGYELARGDRFAMCTIPGGDRPSDALVAAAQKDPTPTTSAARLRNCSVLFWTDLTKWRVVAADAAPQRSTNLIAMSPSGGKVAYCTLVPKPDGTAAPGGSGPGVFPAAGYVRQKFDDKFAQFGLGYSQGCTGCETKYYDGFGRVASNITRIRIAPVGSRNVHDLAVHDGWYALSWFDPDPHGTGKYKLTAYDAAGNVLKTVHN